MKKMMMIVSVLFLMVAACAGGPSKVALRLNGQRVELGTDEFGPVLKVFAEGPKKTFVAFAVQECSVKCKVSNDCTALRKGQQVDPACIVWKTCRQYSASAMAAKHRTFDQMGQGVNGAQSEGEIEGFLDADATKKDTPTGTEPTEDSMTDDTSEWSGTGVDGGSENW